MDRGETNDWLRHRIKTRRSEHLAMAVTSGLAGFIVTGIGTVVGTAILFAVIRQIFEIGHAWLDWQTTFHASLGNITPVAVGLLALQSLGFRRRDTDYIFHVSGIDWRAGENAGLVLSFVWYVMLDLVHSGPRMIAHALGLLASRRAMADINLEICGHVLSLLHCDEHRVSFAEMEEYVPDFETEIHLPQLLQIHGLLHLPSEPPGLSLSTDLRKTLGAPTQAQRRESKRPPTPPPSPVEAMAEPSAEEEPVFTGPKEAKPPSFRCAGCHKKFRLRNLQGDVTFSCPRCGEFYRTLADNQGRVRIERQSEDYDPTADLSLAEDGAEAFFVLGLHPAATRDEVKKAYRRLMKEHHPDKAAGISPVQKKLNEDRAREINRAYGEIMDRLGG